MRVIAIYEDLRSDSRDVKSWASSTAVVVVQLSALSPCTPKPSPIDTGQREPDANQREPKVND